MGNNQTTTNEEKEEKEKGDKRFLGWDVLTVIALKCARKNKDMIYPLYRTCKRFYKNGELKRMYKRSKINKLIYNIDKGNYEKLKLNFNYPSQNKKDKDICHIKYVHEYPSWRMNVYTPYFKITPPDANHKYLLISYRNMEFKVNRIRFRYFMKTIYLEIER